MLNSKETRFFNPSTIAVTAFAICGITLAAAMPRAPAEAMPTAFAASAALSGDTGYLPAQISSRAVEIEPMPEAF